MALSGLSPGLLPPPASGPGSGCHPRHPASLFSVLSSGGFTGPALASPGLGLSSVSEARARSYEPSIQSPEASLKDQDRAAEMTLKQDDSNDTIETETGETRGYFLFLKSVSILCR